jgi:hypothetical protein
VLVASPDTMIFVHQSTFEPDQHLKDIFRAKRNEIFQFELDFELNTCVTS